MTLDLERIVRLAQAAEQGARTAHWVVTKRDDGSALVYAPNNGLMRMVVPLAETDHPRGEFIAACDPQTVLALVEEIRRLRASTPDVSKLTRLEVIDEAVSFEHENAWLQMERERIAKDAAKDAYARGRSDATRALLEQVSQMAAKYRNTARILRESAAKRRRRGDMTAIGGPSELDNSVEASLLSDQALTLDDVANDLDTLAEPAPSPQEGS